MTSRITFIVLFHLCSFSSYCQNSNAKGNLFIIGGGDRSLELVQKLIETAKLGSKDYIAILPMSGSEPDTSFYYTKTDLEKACSNTIANLNFTADKVNNRQWLDSLQHAKLIFITGGDQSRFMKIVLHTPVYNVIHTAYNNGSTVAGTSAGAAVMSRYMITGNQLLGDTSYSATFDKLLDKNIEFSEGLGLLDDAIIDQHFVVRSRYNRLLSALAAFPQFNCIGIDEATAIIVHGKKVTVTGESQVLRFARPKDLQINSKGLIKFSDVQLSIYTSGDMFDLK